MDTYEKKYKEALEMAQKLYQDCPNGKNDRIYHTTDLEKMFPELKESEDERIRKEIINYFEKGKEYLSLCSIGKYDILAWLENIPYTIDHEKREGFHLGYKAALEKQCEQKPAWSEEDENYLNTTIAYLKDANEFKKTAEKCITWLKSLGPQNNWKPSDEQMESLEQFISEYKDIDDSNRAYPISHIIESLYNDLKKLKGE